MSPYLEKTHHKKGLVEWLMVQALSSSPSTAKKKKRMHIIEVVCCFLKERYF
jgi:hypothetical protein